MTERSLSQIEPEELLSIGVWRFTRCTSGDDTAVVPVRTIPVRSLKGQIAVTHISLANGRRVVGAIGNLDLERPELNEHFLTLSVFDQNGRVIHLARYHDLDVVENGPAALAVFQGLRVEDVFPIAFDLSHLVSVAPASAVGQIRDEPSKRLSRAEVIALAVP
jgi:hypothetical protein